MQHLKDLRVGDRVVIESVNHKPQFAAVTKVGRKLIHVGRYSFRLENGECNDDYGHERLLTLPEYEWKRLLERSTSKLKDLGIQLAYSKRFPEHLVPALLDAVNTLLDKDKEST